MFIKLTNYDTGAAFLVNPENFIIHAPRSKLLMQVQKGGEIEVDAVMICPWTNPNIGIRIKEDFETVEALINRSAWESKPIIEKRGDENAH